MKKEYPTLTIEQILKKLHKPQNKNKNSPDLKTLTW